MRRPSTDEHRRAVLADALALIEADLGTELNLDDVARSIATSRRQLQRCFDEHAGESFRECVHRLRMERAAELLSAAPQSTVRDVAATVGYRQPAQFSKAFRRRHGMSPGEYRRAA